jgi:hypothetical protein
MQRYRYETSGPGTKPREVRRNRSGRVRMGNELCSKWYLSVDTMYRIKFAPSGQPIVVSLLGCLHPWFPSMKIQIWTVYTEYVLTIIMETIGTINAINIFHPRIYNKIANIQKVNYIMKTLFIFHCLGLCAYLLTNSMELSTTREATRC